MDITTGFFYLFAAVMLCAALATVSAKNPVHAALYLVLTFTQAAALWLMLEAEFLAIVLIVVYIGAVMVLFLFVVMMLDIRVDRLRSEFWRHLPLSLAVGIFVAFEMIAVVFNGFDTTAGVAPVIAVGGQLANTKALGLLMYTKYAYPIEIAAVILTVAMIAAIALTMRDRKDTRSADVADQIRVKSKDRLAVVSVATEALPFSAPNSGAENGVVAVSVPAKQEGKST